MKKINFITPLSSQQQYEIDYWFNISCIIFIALIVISFFSLIPKIMHYTSIKKEVSDLYNKTKEYGTLSGQKKKLEKELEQLSIKDNKINIYTQQVKNPYLCLKTIVDNLSKDIQLQSFQSNKNEFTFTINCSKTKDIQTLIEKLLVSSLFTDVSLYSFQQNQTKELTCIIKAYSKKAINITK